MSGLRFDGLFELGILVRNVAAAFDGLFEPSICDVQCQFWTVPFSKRTSCCGSVQKYVYAYAEVCVCVWMRVWVWHSQVFSSSPLCMELILYARMRCVSR